MICASGIAQNCPIRRVSTARKPSSGLVRSSQSLSTTIPSALLEPAPPSNEKPETAIKSVAAGSFFTISPSLCITSWVRPLAAASGNCTSTKRKPWSSAGTKPVGTVFTSQPAAAKITTANNAILAVRLRIKLITLL